MRGAAVLAAHASGARDRKGRVSDGTSGREQLARLVAHLRWADALALRTLREAPSAPAKALELLAHILAAEAVWLARIEERAAPTPVWPALSLDECERLAAETHRRLEAFVAALDDAGLARAVRYRNSAGEAFTSRVDDMLLQVVTHGAYHRGQVAALVRAAGDAPRPTDYIAFVRGAPAATRADGR